MKQDDYLVYGHTPAPELTFEQSFSQLVTKLSVAINELDGAEGEYSEDSDATLGQLQEHIRELATKFQSKKLGAEYPDDLNTQLCLRPEENVVAIKLSICYAALSMNFADNGNMESAWGYLTKACEQYAYADALQFFIAKSKIKKNSQSQGGASRNSGNKKVRAEVIRLLAENRPEKGWSKKISAAEKLSPLISTFVKELEKQGIAVHINKEDIQGCINSWLVTDKEVKAAFDSTSDRPA